MNWYKIFYLFSIADKVSGIFGAVALVCLIIGACVLIFGAMNSCVTEDFQTPKKWGITIVIIGAISGLLYAFTPDRKDLALIVAGGAVGEFLVNDPNAKELPTEISKFLREEIQKATADIHKSEEVDKLKNYSKEQLIELITKDDK